MDLDLDVQLLRAAGVRLLVAFGSRIAGTARPGSDLDLGVTFAPGPCPDILEIHEIVNDAVRGAGAELDVVALDRADPLLLFEVASRGRPLFEAEPGVFEEFRIRAVKRYYDTAWLRRLERDALRARYG